MHPATLEAVAAQQSSDLLADAAAARRARQARRSQRAQQDGEFRTRQAAGAALSTRFCQTLAVASNADAAVATTPERRPLRWTATLLSGYRGAAGSPAEP